MAFRGDGHDGDSATARFLPPLKFLPIGVSAMFQRMGASRTVLIRKVGAFDVDSRHATCYFRVLLAGLTNRPNRVPHQGRRMSRQCRTGRGQAITIHGQHDLPHFINGQVGIVEILPSVTVHLDIDKSWGQNSPVARQASYLGLDPRNAISGDVDADRPRGRVVQSFKYQSWAPRECFVLPNPYNR